MTGRCLDRVAEKMVSVTGRSQNAGTQVLEVQVQGRARAKARLDRCADERVASTA